MKNLLFAALLSFTGCCTYAASGEEIFQNTCSTCHAQGLAGAPKVSDKNAWAKLIKEGQMTLTADGYKGVRAMPPKGGRAELSVSDFAAAVVYMANQSDANWVEPDDAMLKKIKALINKDNNVKQVK